MAVTKVVFVLMILTCNSGAQTREPLLSVSPFVAVTRFAAHNQLHASVGFGALVGIRLSDSFSAAISGQTSRTAQTFETVSGTSDLPVRASSAHLYLMWSAVKLPAQLAVDFGAGVGATQVVSDPLKVSLGALGAVEVPARSITHGSFALIVMASKRVLPWMSIDIHPHLVTSSFGTNFSLGGGVTIEVL